jgi:hypothetical protein
MSGLFSSSFVSYFAQALDGLTNNENKLSSFYMRALFWIFPSVLSIGKKGKMIRRVKAELGAIACKMWRDAKTSLDAHSTEDDKTLMALMCGFSSRYQFGFFQVVTVKADAASDQQLCEDEIVAQMRTVLSAGVSPTRLGSGVCSILSQYETVSAIVAVILKC